MCACARTEGCGETTILQPWGTPPECMRFIYIPRYTFAISFFFSPPSPPSPMRATFAAAAAHSLRAGARGRCVRTRTAIGKPSRRLESLLFRSGSGVRTYSDCTTFLASGIACFNSVRKKSKFTRAPGSN